METTKIPTVADVKAKLASVDLLIAGFSLHHAYTIEDYPIGRRDRGRCEMTYIHNRSKGWRTSRRTTDKGGCWCKPKLSVYHTNPIIVVTGPGVDKEAAWLCFGENNVYLQMANGACKTIAGAPHYSKPRREPYTYTVTTTRMTVDASGLIPCGQTSEQRTLEADPPELCDAYDAYLEWFRAKLTEIGTWLHANAPVFA
jgi:hypothetical protein